MGDQMAMIVGVACSLVALVLAWRAYRSAAAEHEERKREKERRDWSRWSAALRDRSWSCSGRERVHARS